MDEQGLVVGDAVALEAMEEVNRRIAGQLTRLQWASQGERADRDRALIAGWESIGDTAIDILRGLSSRLMRAHAQEMRQTSNNRVGLGNGQYDNMLVANEQSGTPPAPVPRAVSERELERQRETIYGPSYTSRYPSEYFQPGNTQQRRF